MEEKLTHFDEKGNAIMVDVTEKKITRPDGERASGKIHVNEAVMKRFWRERLPRAMCWGWRVWRESWR